MLYENDDIKDAETAASTGKGASVPYSLGPKWARTAIVCAEVLVVGFLAHQLSRYVTRYQENAGWQLPVVDVPAPDRAASAYTLNDKSLSFDPFYREEKKALAQPTFAPESSMKLTIFGLRADGKGGGSVILKTGSDDQTLVAVGDEIMKGVSLAGVYADRIEISRAGVRETVFMYPEEVRKKGASTQLRKRASGNRDTASSAGRVTAFSALTALDLKPVRTQGRVSGFVVGSAAKENSLGLTDLMKGDIITSVNGEKLTSFERLIELPEELAEDSVLVLEYERRGEQRIKRIDIK